MNDQTTPATFEDVDDALSNYAIAAIDYAEIIASTEPDQPGGRIVYDSDDYETDEEADAALEEFFTRIIEAPYEEAK
jgi:hypothetical protein